ncbi:MAG: response regulator [Alphaproteobacteria bacterium]|nr:response regulator [Alphaproteobacteria bacterium]MCB9691286.1 response regulator [Alphaproteobacteria bacterium]
MRILIVEDHDLLRERLGRALQARGHEVLLAADGATARAHAAAEPTHAVVDLRLGEEDGLAVLADVREVVPDLVSVVLTGYGSIATAVEALRLGAVNVLQKPADADMVLAAFEKADLPPLHETSEYVPPTLARAEWEHIQRVLADCAGNVSEAARRLGIHRRTLQRKLQKHPPRD